MAFKCKHQWEGTIDKFDLEFDKDWDIPALKYVPPVLAYAHVPTSAFKNNLYASEGGTNWMYVLTTILWVPLHITIGPLLFGLFIVSPLVRHRWVWQVA